MPQEIASSTVRRTDWRTRLAQLRALPADEDHQKVSALAVERVERLMADMPEDCYIYGRPDGGLRVTRIAADSMTRWDVDPSGGISISTIPTA